MGFYRRQARLARRDSKRQQRSRRRQRDKQRDKQRGKQRTRRARRWHEARHPTSAFPPPRVADCSHSPMRCSRRAPPPTARRFSSPPLPPAPRASCECCSTGPSSRPWTRWLSSQARTSQRCTWLQRGPTAKCARCSYSGRRFSSLASPRWMRTAALRWTCATPRFGRSSRICGRRRGIASRAVGCCARSCSAARMQAYCALATI